MSCLRSIGAFRLFRILLRALPDDLRRRHGSAMSETFESQCQQLLEHRRGLPALAALTALLGRASLDLIWTSLRERAGLDDPLYRLPHSLLKDARNESRQMPAMTDFKYSFRLLRRRPIFSAFTVLVLAGGLGVSIFAFSFLHTAMLKPLPLEEGEDVVRIMAGWNGRHNNVDAADFAAIRPSLTTLTDVGAFTQREILVGGDDGLRPLYTMLVEASAFTLARTPPLLGRPLLPADELPGAAPVAVLSYTTWQSMFGGDPAIVGTLVEMAATPTQIVGVMPSGYGFPVVSDLWMPIDRTLLEDVDHGEAYVGVHARTAPGTTEEQIDAELAVLLERTHSTAQALDPGSGESGEWADSLVARTFQMAQMGDEGPITFGVLLLLALLILVLACINVSNLLLARTQERSQETAIRLALGASRSRLILQSMWESVFLCVSGGVLAVLLAGWGLHVVNGWAHRQLEGNLAFWWVWGLDRYAIGAAACFVALTILVLGGVVALRASSPRFNSMLREGAGGGDRRSGRGARMLVVAQVAAVTVLMFFGTLSAVLAKRIATVDVGMNTNGLLSVAFDLPEERYDSAEARLRFSERLYAALEGQPAFVGVTLRAPLGGPSSDAGEYTLGSTPDEPGQVRPRADVLATLGPVDYLGIRLLEGRLLDQRDRATSSRSAVISERLARRHWPQGSALGERVRLAGVGEDAERTIVGVVSDVTYGNPMAQSKPAGAIYVPLSQTDATHLSVVFRHAGNSAEARGVFQDVVQAADPDLEFARIASYDEMLEQSSMLATATAKLFLLCFAFALSLAVAGIYGLTAWSVARRTREIGVRRALGASDASIQRLFLRQGGRQLAIGVAIALPISLAIGAAFSRVFPIGTSTYVTSALAVSLVVTSMMLLASYLPTRRAVDIEPRDALWQD